MTSVLMVDHPRTFRANGVGRYLLQLTKAIATIPSIPEIDVLHFGSVLTISDWQKRVLEYPRMPRWYLKLHTKYGLGWAIRRSNATLIHYMQGNLHRNWDVGCARRILTLHGMGQYTSLPWYHQWQKERANKLHQLFARGRHKLIHVITVSNYVKTQAMAELGLDSDEITVIPHGIDFDCLYPEPNSQDVTKYLEKYFGLNVPYWFHLSAGGPRKNVVRQIQSFAQLKNRLKLPHKFVIAGVVQQVHFQRIFDEAKRLGVAQDLIILSEIRDDQHLRMLYNGADLFLFPSLYEGFGIPIIEAMACGTPVVTSNIHSMPEVSGHAAALVDEPTDVDNLVEVIERVIEDGDYRQQLHKRGLVHASQFTWKKTARQHIQVYQQVLGNIE